ncbi:MULTISPECIES: TetR/AcrR family transcriptional regulator [Desulfosediminicola]|uniref:TetR/AcrR family transcriptional regulator n=1 Tax=Desulfosediminicola TaxID=2886823 RepID=UPI0010AC0D66|nr:TetR/AcrR family transcriptional regulator [Desulfosediminicola ganghwensis]
MSGKTQERRGLILSTALRLFFERGYFNTSVHDIQKEAGVSIGSIYHHFGNKESIAKELFQEIETSMTRVLTEIMEIHETAHDRCRSVVQYLFDETETNRAEMHYMLYAKHQEFMPGEKPVCSSRPFTLMKQMVIEGIDAGHIRPVDPNVAAVTLFGGAIRLIFLRLDGVLERPLPDYLEECWECAWRGVAK